MFKNLFVFVRLVYMESISLIPHLLPRFSHDHKQGFTLLYNGLLWGRVWASEGQPASWEAQLSKCPGYLKSNALLSWALGRQLTWVASTSSDALGSGPRQPFEDLWYWITVLSGNSGPAHALFGLDMCYFYSFVYWFLLRVQLSNRTYLEIKGLLEIRHPFNLWPLGKNVACTKVWGCWDHFCSFNL